MLTTWKGHTIGGDNMARQYSRPIQESPEYIARTLRRDFSAEPSIHAAINRVVPILEEYAQKDKSRASRYRKVAQGLRNVSSQIKSLIKEYE